LEHEAHRSGTELGSRIVLHRCEIRAVDQDLALVDALEPRKAVEERGLAGAGRADDGDHLPPGHIQIDLAECFDFGPAVVHLAHAGGTNDRVHGWISPCSLDVPRRLPGGDGEPRLGANGMPARAGKHLGSSACLLPLDGPLVPGVS
jgi:hypothetical protein